MEIELSPKRRLDTLPLYKPKESQIHYLIIDTETKFRKAKDGKIEHIPFLICYQELTLYSDGKSEESEIKHCETIKAIHKEIESQATDKHRITLIAHNSNYDMSVIDIFNFFDTYGYSCQVYNPHKGAFYMRFVKHNAAITIIDNMNFFQGALADLGKELGIPKLTMPKTQKLTPAFLRYCKQDVRIVTEGLKNLSKICAKYGYGQLAITRAKLCYSIYLSNFLNTFVQTHKDVKALTMEYQAYYGGRTEAWYQGKLPTGRYYYVDFNSLYPSVMKDNKFASKLRFRFSNMPISKALDKMKRYNILAEIEVMTDKPCLPFKVKGSILFPVGNFITTVSNPELKLALEMGIVKKIRKGYLYKKDEIFTEYIEHFHKLKTRYKRENKPIFTYFTKLMLNSLYGKFGQRIPTLENTGKTSDKKYDISLHYDFTKGVRTQYKTINYQVFKESNRQVSPLSVPIIAAEIASFARVKLWKAIEQAGVHNVFYMDTDSLMVNRTGYNNLKKSICNNKLGKLELEACSNKVTIHGLKDYEFGDTIRHKSIPKRSLELSKGIFEFEYFSTLGDMLRTEWEPKQYTIKKRKELKREIKKGVKLPTNRVIAWNFDKSLTKMK